MRRLACSVHLPRRGSCAPAALPWLPPCPWLRPRDQNSCRGHGLHQGMQETAAHQECCLCRSAWAAALHAPGWLLPERPVCLQLLHCPACSTISWTLIPAVALSAMAEQQQLEDGTGAALSAAVSSGPWRLKGRLQHWPRHAAFCFLEDCYLAGSGISWTKRLLQGQSQQWLSKQQCEHGEGPCPVCSCMLWITRPEGCRSCTGPGAAGLVTSKCCSAGGETKPPSPRQAVQLGAHNGICHHQHQALLVQWGPC